MATSSIFHNVVIDNQKKADDFISAIEASVADPYKMTGHPKTKVESDPKKINHLLELWNNGAKD